MQDADFQDMICVIATKDKLQLSETLLTKEITPVKPNSALTPDQSHLYIKKYVFSL